MRNSFFASTAATAVLACGLMGQPALGKPAPTGTFSNAFCHAYPGPSAAFMYLLTDGTVLVHDQGSGNNSNWYRLTPDNTGSYTCGTWTPTYPTPGSIASCRYGLLRPGLAKYWRCPGRRTAERPMDDWKHSNYETSATGSVQRKQPHFHCDWLWFQSQSHRRVGPDFAARWKRAFGRQQFWWWYPAGQTQQLFDTAQENGPQILLTDGTVLVVGANAGLASIYTPPSSAPPASLEPGSMGEHHHASGDVRTWRHHAVRGA